jgi:hypothetical protein
MRFSGRMDFVSKGRGRGSPFTCAAAALLLAVLTGCAVAPDNFAAVFVDPTKYDFQPCTTLVKKQEGLAKRERELRLLMDKAEQGTGGTVVNALAYRTDYLNARGELQLIQEVIQRKECARDAKPAQETSPTR